MTFLGNILFIAADRQRSECRVYMPVVSTCTGLSQRARRLLLVGNR